MKDKLALLTPEQLEKHQGIILNIADLIDKLVEETQNLNAFPKTFRHGLMQSGNVLVMWGQGTEPMSTEMHGNGAVKSITCSDPEKATTFGTEQGDTALVTEDGKGLKV